MQMKNNPQIQKKKIQLVWVNLRNTWKDNYTAKNLDFLKEKEMLKFERKGNLQKALLKSWIKWAQKNCNQIHFCCDLYS